MNDIQILASRQRLTVGEWVRRTLREARAHKPVNDPEMKLNGVRRAADCSFPSTGIKQMFSEIERGYEA